MTALLTLLREKCIEMIVSILSLKVLCKKYKFEVKFKTPHAHHLVVKLGLMIPSDSKIMLEILTDIIGH